MKLNKVADSDKYRFSGYGNGFDTRLNFSVYGELGKNVIIFVVGNILSVNSDHRRKDIVVFDEWSTDG